MADLRPLSPQAREAEQLAILDRWGALGAWEKNRKLTRERLRQGVAEPAQPTYPLNQSYVDRYRNSHRLSNTRRRVA